MTRRAALRLAIALGLAYVAVALAAGAYLAEGVVRPPRIAVTGAGQNEAARIAAAHAARLESLELVARDGARLRAWLFTPTASPKGAAIVLHGQASNRAGMLPYIDLMLAGGLTVLAPDARAQGDSEGTIATYGVVEAADVRRWVRELRERSGGGCVYGLAASMGAGTLLQSLDASGAFCAVVVESPFASFREVAYDRIGAAAHAGPWLARTILRPIVESGLLYTRARYGIDLGRADPRAAIARTSVPILLIHGTADTSIPIRHSRLLAAARPTHTTLWEVPGAEHCGALGVAPREFGRRLLATYAATPERSTTR